MRADLTIFVDEAPTVTLGEDGFFHVVDRSGDYVVERILSPSDLRLYVQRANRALDEWAERRGTLPLRDES
jgi:hypothetical protein